MHKRRVILAVTTALAMPLIQAAERGSPAIGQVAAPPAAREYKAKSPKLSRAELDALLAKPEQVLILDVRRPDEIAAIGGLPAYLSIQAKDLERNIGFVPKDRTIVTASNHAGRAGAAADLLASHGFKVAGAVGVQDYEAEGGTLTKIIPSSPRAVEAERR